MNTMAPPRVTSLKVQNYRGLRNVLLSNLTPLTVLLGPNGSGKSTVFDVFAFLSECFTDGIRRAWDRRGRFRELRSRESDGPVVIEFKYRERPRTPLITYHLEIDEEGGRPIVTHEFLRWTRGGRAGRPFNFMEYRRGDGEVITGEAPERDDRRMPRKLSGPDVLAVSTLGMLAENPRVIAFRDFVTSWHLSYLSADAARGNPEAGGQERLSPTGDNLANVIQHLREQHPERLDEIFEILRRRVPRIEQVQAEALADGRLLLRIKDAPFATPVLSRFASDGTLKMLAYLTLLHDPTPPKLIGVEEPENFLHPRLLPELAEECRAASERTQLLITSHSPFFVDELRPAEVRVLWRDGDGYTQVQRISDSEGVNAFVEEGARLGDLWMEGHFGAGDPLVNQGGPSRMWVRDSPERSPSGVSRRGAVQGGVRKESREPEEQQLNSPAIERQIRAILISRARNKRPPITYADLCKQVPRAPPYRSPELYALLGEVSRRSHRKHGIFLTALVVSDATRIPGEGFFTKLAIPIVGAVPNRKHFWERQRDLVYEFYARQAAE